MLSFDIYLLVPILASLFLCWFTHCIPGVDLLTLRLRLLPVLWPALIEAIFTIAWISLANDLYEDNPLVRNFFSQGLISSNGTVWSFWSDFDILEHQFPFPFCCFLFDVCYWPHFLIPGFL